MKSWKILLSNLIPKETVSHLCMESPQFCWKGLHNLGKFKGPGKRGHIVADTLLLMMFLGLRKLGNICCGHKMFLNKLRNVFCVPDRKFVSATNVARVGKRGNIFVGNNVSSFAMALSISKLTYSGMNGKYDI